MLEVSEQNNTINLFFLGLQLEISEHADIKQERRRIYLQNLKKIFFINYVGKKLTSKQCLNLKENLKL